MITKWVIGLEITNLILIMVRDFGCNKQINLKTCNYTNNILIKAWLVILMSFIVYVGLKTLLQTIVYSKTK